MMTTEDQKYLTLEEAAEAVKAEMERGGWTGGVKTIASWVYRRDLKTYRIYRGGRARRGVNLEELRAYIKRHTGESGEVEEW